MQAEKRQYPRKESNFRVSITFDNGSLSGNLVNISKTGAFLELDREHSQRITKADQGLPVSFRMDTDNSSLAYKGTICRYTDDGTMKYLAIAFSGPSKIFD
jgi:hypothetical protein